ncbi:MAG: hypothetical protein RQ741_13520, partial [Wenzhouxiangellaceae bacterium]|nr:hypothetical protein [Wenzhouxiangellaceae bacterium]
MKYWLGSLFHRNAHSPLRRLYFAWLKYFTGVFSKRQAVFFVKINGKRYKKVALGDSLEATQVEQALVALPFGRYFPPLIHRHENQLLMGFVEGRGFDASNEGDRDALAVLLGDLYAQGHRTMPAAPYQARLEIDIRFLIDVGLIEAELGDALLARAESVRPVDILVGLDYVDPVEKNFVVRDGQIYAIDVESLRSNIALGTGILKAGLHWLKRDQVAGFTERVEQAAGVDLHQQLEFVELCFRVGWIKRKLLQ